MALSKKFCLVTVVESIAITSMPLNEFVLYKCQFSQTYRQILIVCSKELTCEDLLPSQVEVKLVGRNVKQMRSYLHEIVQSCKDNHESLVVHLHAPRSAFFFHMSSIGMNLRKKTVFTVHSTYKGRNLKYRFFSSLIALLSNYVVCVSHAALNGYSPIIKAIKGKRMIVILNGVDIDRINSVIPNSEVLFPNLKKMICVGRLIPIKNQQFLIRLLPSLPEMELILVGQGQDDAFLKDLSNQLHVANRVKFCGLLRRENVFKILSECGIYVSASKVEGLPISVLEAMAVGVYPIISMIPSHMDISAVCDNVTILPLDSSIWIRAINRFLQTTSEERENISVGLKSDARRNFSLEKMHQSYNQIYELLAEQ